MRQFQMQFEVQFLVNEVEQKLEVESVVRKCLDRITRKLEMLDPNFYCKQVKDKKMRITMKFSGRQKKLHLTWAEKANIMYFYLHPNFGNRRADLTCALFEVKPSTLRWLTNPTFVRKWLLLSRMLSPAQVQNRRSNVIGGSLDKLCVQVKF